MLEAVVAEGWPKANPDAPPNIGLGASIDGVAADGVETTDG